MPKPGMFCWVDLTATDYDGSIAFYGKVFGWTHEDTGPGGGGRYGMFAHDGQIVAGIGEVPPGAPLPAVWNNYVASDDVRASVAKAKALGAEVIFDAYETPTGSGCLAYVKDPTGAVVALWQAKSHAGGAKFNLPVSLCWNELATRDIEAAKTFYAGLFGWTYAHQPGPTPIVVVQNEGRANGHLLQMNEQWEGMPPAWAPYFAVADVDATCAAITANGGTVAVPPTDIAPGRFAVIADPQGAHTYLIRLNAADPQPA